MKQRHGPSLAFLAAGAVAIAGLVLEELAGVTDFDVWPWLVASGIAYSIGVTGLLPRIGRPVARTIRVGRAAAVIAGVGASTYVLVTLGFRAADLLGLTLPAPLEGLFLVGALAFLVGVCVASILAGVNVRRGERATIIRVLLGGCAIFFLSPLPALVGVSVPQWLAPTVVAVLAIAFLVLGYLVRLTVTRSST